MNLAIVIPIRGFQTSMSRIRDHLEKDVVNQLVKELFEKTLKAIDHVNVPKIIVTSDKTLNNDYPDFEFIFDEGTSLNNALTLLNEKYDYSHYFLIMPDLPKISKKAISKILRLNEIVDNIVLNTEDDGTAACILPATFYSLGLFGENSANKIIEKANLERTEISKIIMQDLQKDLDTIGDYQYWRADLDKLIIKRSDSE